MRRGLAFAATSADPLNEFRREAFQLYQSSGR